MRGEGVGRDGVEGRGVECCGKGGWEWREAADGEVGAGRAFWPCLQP